MERLPLVVCLIVSVFILCWAPVAQAQNNAVTPIEEPELFREVRLAMDAWNYNLAETLLARIHPRSQRREQADRLLTRIKALKRYVVQYRVNPGDTWESVSMIYFRSADYVGRLAQFNQRAIDDELHAGETIYIPRIHVDVLLGFSVFELEGNIRIEDMAAGLRMLENAYSLDPDYPGLTMKLERARHQFSFKLNDEKIDSLEMTAELYVARREFSQAIDCLRKAQAIQSNHARERRIQTLIDRRQDYLPVLFELGNAAFRENDLENALKYWQQVYEADPGFRDVGDRLEKTRNLLQHMDSATREKK